MIYIDLKDKEPDTDEWKEWRETCDTQQALIIQKTQEWLIKWANIQQPTKEQLKEKKKEKPKANDKIYNNPVIKKNFYIHKDGPFRGRCAYCETPIIESRQPGHLDHFRPKGAVKDYTNGKELKVTINGTEDLHPGYYWLCYDWKNLLPTCHKCNSPTTETETFGKHDFFPVEDEQKRAINPDDIIDDETPLLINPTEINPDDHLYMDKTGTMFWRSKKGKICVKILGLNLSDLPDTRKMVYDDFKKKTIEYSIKMQDIRSQGINSTPYLDNLLAEVKAAKNGELPYTMAAKLGIEDGKQEALELQKKALDSL